MFTGASPLTAVGGGRKQVLSLAGMAALFFLAVCTVGILRPIKNSLALDGLASTEFYKVYLVSAAVILFVPLYNRLSDRVPLRWLIPAVAIFFAMNLVAFRTLYVEGSAVFGMVFYGWYDLFAAALVTQFFIATQLLFDARSAKRAYPLIIVGGALGASLGGAITGLFAERIGTPDLMLIAAGIIVVFGTCLPLVWDSAVGPPPRGSQTVRKTELRALVSNPHVRLIAATVLIAVLIKQLVDYQFNTLTREIFETRDAVSAFQGKFNAATQFLPILILFGLRPLLRRWGVGLVVLLLPLVMLGANLGLAIFWGLAAAVLVKAGDTGLRYSAERTAREILYVPVPESLKLKAKTYIDVAIEKGLGKALSAVFLFALLAVMDYRHVAYVAAGLSLIWVALAVAVRREYVRTLGQSLEGRFASLRGSFASLTESNALGHVRTALTSGDAVRAAFALDLLEQATLDEARGLETEVRGLLTHPEPELRRRAVEALTRADGGDHDWARPLLADPDPGVREAAVRALCGDSSRRERVLRELVAAPERSVRLAALACLARGELGPPGAAAEDIQRILISDHAEGGDSEQRSEVALAAGAVPGHPAAAAVLEPLVADPDTAVASAALRSAGLLRVTRVYPRMIEALAKPGTREAARDALIRQGEPAVGPLLCTLLDPSVDARIRRQVPRVLAGIPSQAVVDALLRSLRPAETDQLLDHRTVKALSKLRSRYPRLRFDPEIVADWCEREAATARRHLDARLALEPVAGAGGAPMLLDRALHEAVAERREDVFRCLGLLYPPADVYRCFLAVTGGSRRERASALEWLEQSLGYVRFRRLEPALDGAPRAAVRPPPIRQVLDRLRAEPDLWLAECAAAAAVQLGMSAGGMPVSEIAGTGGELDEMPVPEIADTGERSADGVSVPKIAGKGGRKVDLIEKVFLLQNVDLLRDARTHDLALVGSIAEECEARPGEVLVRRGEPPDALYIVVSGRVELRSDSDRMLAGEGSAFGTWSLVDDAPGLVDACAIERTRLLRVSRSDFDDLLADSPELAKGLLRGLASRMRALVS